jgi:hypothetical protein
MNPKVLKRILYVALGLLFFWMAAEHYRDAGLAAGTALSATAGVLFLVLGATGKG